MKKIALLAAACALSFNAFSAQNSSVNTFTGGYAQSSVKFDGESLDDHPKGGNIKYRYEFDENVGVVVSGTYTHQGYEYRAYGRKVGDADLDYYSLLAGPTYRFNEYVSAYGMIGGARGKVDADLLGYSYSESKTSFAYGAGLQFNVYENFVIDASYEYSKLNDVKVGTWVVGVGVIF